MQHRILCVISYELTGLGGGLFKESMHVKKSRTSSSFCTSTRINFSQKHHQEFVITILVAELTLHLDLAYIYALHMRDVWAWELGFCSGP